MSDITGLRQSLIHICIHACTYDNLGKQTKNYSYEFSKFCGNYFFLFLYFVDFIFLILLVGIYIYLMDILILLHEIH